MTQKEIRDIAVYWGAPISYTIQAGNDPNEGDRANGTTRYPKEGFQGAVGIAAIDGLCLWWTANRVADIKLYLRSLNSLTDDEVQSLVSALCDGRQVTTINRPFNLPGVENRYLLYLDGGSSLTINTDTDMHIEWHTRGRYPHVAKAVSYLQSIGVYVPGTIDPQYVELLP